VSLFLFGLAYLVAHCLFNKQHIWVGLSCNSSLVEELGGHVADPSDPTSPIQPPPAPSVSAADPVEGAATLAHWYTRGGQGGKEMLLALTMAVQVRQLVWLCNGWTTIQWLGVHGVFVVVAFVVG
jgi:hypothetical protein